MSCTPVGALHHIEGRSLKLCCIAKILFRTLNDGSPTPPSSKDSGKARQIARSWSNNSSVIGTSFSTPMLTVNLGFLQLAAIISVDHFPLGEHVKSRDTGFPVAVASATCAAEGQLYLGSCCT